MQRYALLLGSNGGPRADSHLKCAESDVDKVHNWLLSNPFWVEENIWLPREEPHRQHKSAYGTGASLPQARTEIAKATKRLTRKDFLFVYFAGHAISDKGDLYLMLANSLDDDPRSCLPAHELIDPFLVHGRARCILVVLDCCFAGMATRYAFARWVKSIESRLAQFTAAQAPEQSDPGRALLAACAADQFAFEPLDEIESSSYFTEAFLAGCDGGSGPLASPSPINENGVVTAGSLHDYLVEALKKRQAPQRAITGESIAIRSSHDWRLQRGQPGYRPPESTMLPEGEGIKMPITNVTPTRVWAHPQGTNKQSTRELNSCASRADLSVVALGYRDLGAELVNGADGTEIPWAASAEAKQTPPHPNAMIFTADGKYLMVLRERLPNGGGAGVHIFDAMTGAQQEVLSEGVDHYAVTPDGRVMVSCPATGLSRDTSIAVYNVDGQILGRTSFSEYHVVHMRPFLNSSRIATGCDDGKIRIWDVGSEPVPSLTHTLSDDTASPPLGAALRVAISADGRYVAAGYQRGRIRIWTPSDLKLQGSSDPSQAYSINALEFSSDGRWLMGGSLDGRIWVVPTSNPAGTSWNSIPLPPPTRPVTSLACLSINTVDLLAVGMSDGRLYLRSPEQHAENHKILIPDHDDRGAIFRLMLAAETRRSASLLIAAQHRIEKWTLAWPTTSSR